MSLSELRKKNKVPSPPRERVPSPIARDSAPRERVPSPPRERIEIPWDEIRIAVRLYITTRSRNRAKDKEASTEYMAVKRLKEFYGKKWGNMGNE